MRYEVYARTGLRLASTMATIRLKDFVVNLGESNRVPIVYFRAFTEYPRAEILISLQRILIL